MHVHYSADDYYTAFLADADAAQDADADDLVALRRRSFVNIGGNPMPWRGAGPELIVPGLASGPDCRPEFAGSDTTADREQPPSAIGGQRQPF